MAVPIEEHLAELKLVCEEYRVARLQLFGSGRTDRFDSSRSDLDFLVEFRPDADKGIAPYLALRAELMRIFSAEVDLVEVAAIRNPYVAERARSEAIELYAAWGPSARMGRPRIRSLRRGIPRRSIAG